MNDMDVNALLAQAMADPFTTLGAADTVALIEWAMKRSATATPIGWIVNGDGLAMNHYCERWSDVERLIKIGRPSTLVTPVYAGMTSTYNMIVKVQNDDDS